MPDPESTGRPSRARGVTAASGLERRVGDRRDRALTTTQARWWFDALAVIKATAESTNGQPTIIEVTEPPGAVAPLHLHHGEDETFYVLDGTVAITVGDDTVDTATGDCAFGPRDVPHHYTVGPRGCRMLYVCTPGVGSSRSSWR